MRDLLLISFCKHAPLDTSLQSNFSLNMQTGKLPVDSLGTRDTDTRRELNGPDGPSNDLGRSKIELS